MLAILASVAAFGLVLGLLVGMARQDGPKVLAALSGHSWLSNPPQAARPITVRVSSRYPAQRPLRVQPRLRAAA